MNSMASIPQTPSIEPAATPKGSSRRDLSIATLAIVGIALHVALRAAEIETPIFLESLSPAQLPLIVVLLFGGVPLVIDLASKALEREFGSDLLAGFSIVTAVVLHEYLAGSLVVLMLSGGQALEEFAIRRASSALTALAGRMPAMIHRRVNDTIVDIPLTSVAVGDVLVVFPHEVCPADGIVVDGHGSMDESYLTGEPYRISKAPGTSVLSGAINGESALSVRAERLPADSRYARIMQVMRDAEQRRPRLRRLADKLGAIYTPIAVCLAVLAWIFSGLPERFLAVLVVATPCPLLIAIPVSIIGAISLSARRGIIIKDPGILERLSQCRTAIFDKTGTLTYGEPRLTEILPANNLSDERVLQLIASLERYSKHPLAQAILDAAGERRIALHEAAEVSERPGEGLRGSVDSQIVQVTSRKKLLRQFPASESSLPRVSGGLECIVVIDNEYAGTLRFRDEPRQDGARFIDHLKTKHAFQRVLLVSGDRESEVRYLAERVGISDVYFSQSPEQKLELVRQETQRYPTVFMGDGINDAPALTAASVGVAFGQNSEVTSEAAGAVIFDSSLETVDELLHIGQHMRAIALQSAIGGMVLSIAGMLLAAGGYLSPVQGAICQEIIDVLAITNALRAAVAPHSLTDYQ
ncbi:MAG: heavy metal translocating P-type ATPase [Planctomycetes bacterium]|nr:heavy metal translocating P-type ATPase [Planctomycetota bacterium]